jgi:hypothetical protein
MDIQRSRAVLESLSAEVLAERQRIVDQAVRAARDTGYCEEFNRMLEHVLPEFVIETPDGYSYSYDSEGVDCRGYRVERRMRYPSSPHYGDDGYDSETGLDRDGFNRSGYDVDGFDARGWGRAYLKERRWYKYTRDEETGNRLYVPCEENDPERYDRERVYLTGYGSATNRDADGNYRPGRPPTSEELAAEAAQEPAFNPTTWKPSLVTVG